MSFDIASLDYILQHTLVLTNNIALLTSVVLVLTNNIALLTSVVLVLTNKTVLLTSVVLLVFLPSLSPLVLPRGIISFQISSNVIFGCLEHLWF